MGVVAPGVVAVAQVVPPARQDPCWQRGLCVGPWHPCPTEGVWDRVLGSWDALQGLLSRAGAELCGWAGAVPPSGGNPSSQDRGSILCWYLVHQLCTGPVLQHNWLCVPAPPKIIPALAFLLSCSSALPCPSVTCTHVPLMPQDLEAPLEVGFVPRGDAQGRARRGRWVPGARQEPREEEQLSEESRLRLMSLRCMVGNYARCNENNKAGSIVVSKNTANAECLLGAFVCHLWVSALGLARWCHTP